MSRTILAATAALFLGGCTTLAPMPTGATNPSDPQHPATVESSLELPVLTPLTAGLSGESSHQKDPFKGTTTPPAMSGSDHSEHAASQATAPADGAAVIYTCSMHPEVLSDKPGKCPKCGMTLVRKGTK